MLSILQSALRSTPDTFFEFHQNGGRLSVLLDLLGFTFYCVLCGGAYAVLTDGGWWAGIPATLVSGIAVTPLLIVTWHEERSVPAYVWGLPIGIEHKPHRTGFWLLVLWFGSPILLNAGSRLADAAGYGQLGSALHAFRFYGLGIGLVLFYGTVFGYQFLMGRRNRKRTHPPGYGPQDGLLRSIS